MTETPKWVKDLQEDRDAVAGLALWLAEKRGYTGDSARRYAADLVKGIEND